MQLEYRETARLYRLFDTTEVLERDPKTKNRGETQLSLPFGYSSKLRRGHGLAANHACFEPVIRRWIPNLRAPRRNGQL